VSVFYPEFSGGAACAASDHNGNRTISGALHAKQFRGKKSAQSGLFHFWNNLRRLYRTVRRPPLPVGLFNIPVTA